jgi:hypothetical protein
VTYNFLNRTGDVPLSAFIDAMAVSRGDCSKLASYWYFCQPIAINTTAAWCSVCANNQDSGCAALALATEQGEAAARPKISPAGAGVLGAGLTLIVVALMGFTLAFFGVLTISRFGRRRSRHPGTVCDLLARLLRLEFIVNISSNSKKTAKVYDSAMWRWRCRGI